MALFGIDVGRGGFRCFFWGTHIPTFAWCGVLLEGFFFLSLLSLFLLYIHTSVFCRCRCRRWAISSPCNKFPPLLFCFAQLVSANQRNQRAKQTSEAKQSRCHLFWEIPPLYTYFLRFYVSPLSLSCKREFESESESELNGKCVGEITTGFFLKCSCVSWRLWW